MVVGLFTFSAANETRRANDEGRRSCITVLEDAGATGLPDERTRSSGCSATDGGAVCDDPGERAAQGDAATRMLMQRRRRTGHAADHRRHASRAGTAGLIQVYCPDELEDFKSYVNDLKLDDMVNQ